MGKKSDDRDSARLRELIEEATVDCYEESEQHQGLVNMVEENVVCPFKAKVIGEVVEVVELCAPPSGFGLDAVCRYKGKDYKIDVRSLQWPREKPEGFEWIEADDATHSVYAYLRKSGPPGDDVLAVLNFTPVPRMNYRLGAPRAGVWRELLNTDAAEYGGSGHGNLGQVETAPVPSHGRPQSLNLTLPPLGGLFLKVE